MCCKCRKWIKNITPVLPPFNIDIRDNEVNLIQRPAKEKIVQKQTLIEHLT